jgi:hypothetical protein
LIEGRWLSAGKGNYAADAARDGFDMALLRIDSRTGRKGDKKIEIKVVSE